MIKPHGGKLVNRISGESYNPSDLQKLDSIQVSSEVAKDIENIADGVFSPLEGFLGKDDLVNVLEHMRLTNDTPWTIPILLDINKDASKKFKIGDDLLITFEKRPLAILHHEEKFSFEKKEIAQKVFGTTDTNHPGVKKTLELNDMFLSGKIHMINRPRSKFEKFHLRPIETRLLFNEKGWRTIVGFQTRNPPHMGHEYVQKTALTFVDGMFINPVKTR
jgi:sulfate adenylyltransferase